MAENPLVGDKMKWLYVVPVMNKSGGRQNTFTGKTHVHMTILYRQGQISTLKGRTYSGHGEP